MEMRIGRFPGGWLADEAAAGSLDQAGLRCSGGIQVWMVVMDGSLVMT